MSLQDVFYLLAIIYFIFGLIFLTVLIGFLIYLYTVIKKLQLKGQLQMEKINQLVSEIQNSKLKSLPMLLTAVPVIIRTIRRFRHR
jgi:uncharacterized membrane protein